MFNKIFSRMKSNPDKVLWQHFIATPASHPEKENEGFARVIAYSAISPPGPLIKR